MRSSMHMPAMVEAPLGHSVAALSERPAPRLTRLLVNVTVEQSPWLVHMLLAVDATVADLAHATATAYSADDHRTPLHIEAERAYAGHFLYTEIVYSVRMSIVHCNRFEHFRYVDGHGNGLGGAGSHCNGCFSGAHVLLFVDAASVLQTLRLLMYRAGPADQGINVGLSLNDIARAYEKKLKINRWKQKKLLQVDNKKKSANDVQNAHVRQAGLNVVKVEKQLLGKRAIQEQAVQQANAKRSTVGSSRSFSAVSRTVVCNPELQQRNRTNLLVEDFTGSTTDESNNCMIPLSTLKGKEPVDEQVVYKDGYCDNKNVEVEGVQVVGFTSTRESDNNIIPEDDRIEGGNNVRQVVMDWTSSSGGAPAADKKASCSSFVRNELIPGHERDDISSDNDDDPNGDTLDIIDVGKAMQEEKEMDDMFKGSAYPSTEEVTQAREPEDGLHFKTRDDAFFFLCTFARKMDTFGSASSKKEGDLVKAKRPRVDCDEVDDDTRAKIPATVARALRMKVGYFPLKGSIRLVELSSSVEFPGMYCLHKDGRLAISGFSVLTNAAELTIDSVVLFTINKGVVADKELLSLVVADLYRKTV
ncbi:hypothetical protein ZWY2020_002361 [Hordeum vulgare]|nr:hypothetical protein ZWY2020_002361 [Hordeum vulgare]